MALQLFTFGHGTAGRDELAELLRGAGIERVVDVRRFPGSRRNEAASRGQIAELCAELGIEYRWDERLGGRRSLDAEQDAASPDKWWRIKAFRAYAAWTRGPEFAAAMIELIDGLPQASTAVMCSESVWWRCHRRIIADVAVMLHGVEVIHLLPGGRRSTHEPSAGARIEDGQLIWDGADDAC